MGRPAQPSLTVQPRAPTYKYTPAMRNPPGAPQVGTGVAPGGGPMPPQAAPAQAVHIQGQEPLTSSMLAQASPQEQKQMLGERLYPLIQSVHSELAGKITGMLLEIDNSELLHMLESREQLKAKVI